MLELRRYIIYDIFNMFKLFGSAIKVLWAALECAAYMFGV